MSEEITCPQCGASVTGRKGGQMDESVRLRCQSCGTVFEYIPGFGSFSIPGEERGAGYAGGFPSLGTGGTDYGNEPGSEIPTGAGGAGAACVVCCILLAMILPLFYLMFGAFVP